MFFTASRRIALVASCLLVGLSNPALAETTSSPDPWQDTDIDFSYVENAIDTDGCHLTEERFLACIMALEAMIQTAPGRLQLAHVAWRGETDQRQRPVTRFGSLLVMQTLGEPGSAPVDVFDELRQQQRRLLDWRAEFRRARAQPVEFASALAWLRANVVEQEREKQYAAAAINGLLGARDAHARIFPAMPPAADSEGGTGGYGLEPSRLSYTGIGVSVQQVADSIVVTGVVSDGPASRAGMQIGDAILAVDGESVEGSTVGQVVNRLRGTALSEVSLTLSRSGERRGLRLRRDSVEVKNVASAVVDDEGQRWGYLNVRSFAVPSTCSDVRRELRTLSDSGIDGLLLDLRDNSGGLIDQAVCVADLFLGPRLPIVEMRSLRNEQHRQTFRTRYAPMSAAPLVLLVNAGSASASEVLLGGLRDHGRALVVGERTFGKGTMQTMRRWGESDSVMQFYTAARMFSPSGRSAQILGFEPDIMASDQPDGVRPGRVVLREGDLFPTALPAVQPAVQVDVQRPEVGPIRRCVAEVGNAERRWRQEERGGRWSDYQKYVGQDVLHCLSLRMAAPLALR